MSTLKETKKQRLQNWLIHQKTAPKLATCQKKLPFFVENHEINVTFVKKVYFY